MNLQRIRTLFTRDLRDAIRDGRILVAIIIPVALAVYYTVAIPDPDEIPSATLITIGELPAGVANDVTAASKERVDVDIDEVTGAKATEKHARSKVEDDDDTVAVVVADDGTAKLIIGGGASGGAELLASIVQQVAAAEPDAQPRVALEREVVNEELMAPFEVLGIGPALGIFSIIMLAAFISFLVIPILLVEEVELGTLDALQMIATTTEIVVAKVLVGLTYCAVSIGITIVAASFEIASLAVFLAAALAVSLSLTGFGLIFGLWLGDPGRVNTWSAVVLIPLLLPVFIVLGNEQPWRIIGELLPPGAGAQLMAGAANSSVETPTLLPIIVLAAWTVLGFALLVRMLNRRSA